jgi:hypothetical protein
VLGKAKPNTSRIISFLNLTIILSSHLRVSSGPLHLNALNSAPCPCGAAPQRSCVRDFVPGLQDRLDLRALGRPATGGPPSLCPQGGEGWKEILVGRGVAMIMGG